MPLQLYIQSFYCVNMFEFQKYQSWAMLRKKLGWNNSVNEVEDLKINRFTPSPQPWGFVLCTYDFQDFN